MHPLLWKQFHRDRYTELLHQAEARRLLQTVIHTRYTARQGLALGLGHILVRWGQKLEEIGQPCCKVSSSSISR